jgi:acetyltransferase-like isoleucine patch superfamily enzyme
VASKPLAHYRAQHQKRLSWMPWLYFVLHKKHHAWAHAWQAEVQAHLMEQETVRLGVGGFISPDAGIFAELGRPIVMGDGCSVATHAFLHGPLTLGNHVSINARASIDGGAKGITIGDGTRIASGATVYAFNHGLARGRAIRSQPVTSQGITIGKDVWVGANAGITDGVHVGDGAVIAMGAIVTKDVAPYAMVAGVPARVVGERQTESSMGRRPRVAEPSDKD